MPLCAVFAYNLLESTAYFLFSLNFTLYLSAVRGYSDVEAGSIYGTFGLAIGLVGAVGGPVIDRLGIERSIWLGSVITLTGRALFAGSETRAGALIGLFVLQSIGLTLVLPSLSIAIRRLVSDDEAGFYYGIMYSLMNVGAFAAGTLTELLRADVESHVGYVRIMWWAAGISVFTTGIGIAFIQRIPTGPPLRRPSMWAESVETLRSPTFWKLVCLNGAMIGARSMFRHMDATLPKYLTRTLGETAHFGYIYDINSVMIIFCVPLAQRVLAKADAYWVIAASALFMQWAPLPFIFGGPSYTSAAGFMVLVSIGEAIGAPKSIQYTLRVAPKGREGLYGVLVNVPLFGVKTLVGFSSGWLLHTYCPAADTSHCDTMWMFIQQCASLSVLILTFNYWWLRIPSAVADEGDELTKTDLVTSAVEDGLDAPQVDGERLVEPL